MEAAIARYLQPRIPGAETITVTNLFRIPGGASRETWMFDAAWEHDGGPHKAHFVLRKDPAASLVESDRETEYAYYTAFETSSVPVPKMRWLEQDESHLGGAFFIMERILDVDSNTRRILEPDYAEAKPKLAREMYEILAAIHAFDWRDTEIARLAEHPTVANSWQRELDYWEDMINRNEIHPQPIARGAIRWLRTNPPPPARRVSVVHGDYRVGNFLYTKDGIKGIVDWEMAHLGDPLEDLAWSFMELWRWGGTGLMGGIISREDAIKAYEESTGLELDREALNWWEVFSGVKGQGIWLTGAKSFHTGGTQEMIIAYTSWGLINRQDEIILRTLGREP